jgi:DME family drug/metabolite transporter
MPPEIVPIISAMGWAVDSILVRRGSRYSSVLSAAFLSYIVTAALMWSYVLVNYGPSIVWQRAVLYFVLSGTLQPLLARIFFYIGLERIGVARAAPIRGTGPLFSVLIAVLYLHERPSVWVYLGAFLIVAGGWLVITRPRESKSDWRLLDAAFPFLAAFLAAFSQNLRRAGLLLLPNPFVAGAVTTGTSLLILTTYLGVRRQFTTMIPSRLSMPFYVPSAFVSAGSQLLVFVALSLGEVSVMVPLLNTQPLFAVLFSLLFLRDVEKVTVNIIIGVLLLLCGAVSITAL